MLPATRTDSLVCASIVACEQRAGYTIVRARSKPNFWFGNTLVLMREPEIGAYGDWLALHARTFAELPIQRHVITWETGRDGALAAYAGPIERQSSTVFAAGQPPPERTIGAQIRALTSAADWEAALELVRQDQLEGADPEHADFAAWRFGICRDDAAAGRCRVWGAFAGHDLAAFAGIYANAEVARFITPITRPALRRRGFFGALSRICITQTRERYPGTLIVIVAASGSDAERVYTQLGFEPIGRQFALIAPVGI